MKFPWSGKVQLEPTTGENAKDSNVIERKIGLSKVGTIFASGASLFSDGYANAAIGPAGSIIKTYIYPDKFLKGSQNGSLLSSMAFAGIIVGQLSFGYISDKIGRKFGMLLCTGIVFVFSALQAASKGPGEQGTINALIAYRFFCGIGIGGEYPTGSVAAAESTENPGIKKNSQQRLFVLATNTMIDFAFVISYFVCLVCLWIFGLHHLNAVWRITLGLGCVPPLFLLYFRLKMVEPDAYKHNSMKNAPIPYLLLIKRYWLRLAAVSITWFLYDWITYPFGIYATSITDVVIPNGTLYETIGWGCLINFFYVPGTVVGAFVVDFIGPKYCMITGLCLQAIFGFALSGAYDKLVPNHIAGFAIMYGLFLSFGELGPGNCLGLLASKAIGPTAARGQLYGIAAAVGKVGAFIGTYTFPQIQASFGDVGTYGYNTGPFWLGSGLAIASAVITLIFIPNIKPDEMIREDAAFREYLAANGYDVSQIGIKDELFQVSVQDVSEGVGADADDKAIKA
ncbi:phospholipid transporter [Naematelia encephala]|uniref:Phospholipid transporter n=1 Tax=Naematelia encephala TaxID=71784 RepID=A0A1Y2B977_9TREE|nr:phospholipid transporter [Naematelia encephala]